MDLTRWHAGEGFFFHKNLPIKWVRIVGLVVAVDEWQGRRVCTVDDSSGACIEASFKPSEKPVDLTVGTSSKANAQIPTVAGTAAPADPHDDVQVGQMVDVKGRLDVFRGERKLDIVRVTLVKGTAQEISLWGKRADFQRTVLDEVWTLRDRDIKRSRKEAERTEEEAQRKRKRLRDAIDQSKVHRRRNGAHNTAAPPKEGKTDNMREMIRDGAMRGKYSALGL